MFTMEDLVRETDLAHIDYEDLTRALSKMKDVADYVNEKKREAENINEVFSIQEQIIFPSSEQVRKSILNSPTRSL